MPSRTVQITQLYQHYKYGQTRSATDPDVTEACYDAPNRYTVKYTDNDELVVDDWYMRQFLPSWILYYLKQRQGESITLNLINDQVMNGVVAVSGTTRSDTARTDFKIWYDARDEEKAVPLESTIAHGILAPYFIKKVMDKCGQPVKLEVGAVAQPAEIHEALEVGPELKYTNGNQPLCVNKSLASTVDFAKDAYAGAQINAMARSARASMDAFEYVKDLCNSSAVSGWYVESLPPNYDILAPDIDPVVAQIQYGGKQQHAVTLMGGFIFDANHKRALERSPRGLDAACPGEATFERVVRGFRLKPSKRALARIARAPADEAALEVHKLQQQACGEAAAGREEAKKAAKTAAKKAAEPRSLEPVSPAAKKLKVTV